jgi:hypothetical protein
MKDRRPGKLPGGILQAIDDGFVRWEDVGFARIEWAVLVMRPLSRLATHLTCLRLIAA